MTAGGVANVRILCGFVCRENRPEPDILWLQPRRYGKVKPTAENVLLLIEVTDSSLKVDLTEKAHIYAEAGVLEYWVVDNHSARIPVMTDSDGQTFRKIELVVSPQTLSPRCHRGAFLNSAELFEVVR